MNTFLKVSCLELWGLLVTVSDLLKFENYFNKELQHVSFFSVGNINCWHGDVDILLGDSSVCADMQTSMYTEEDEKFSVHGVDRSM